MIIDINLQKFLMGERSKAIGYLKKRYSLDDDDAEDCFQEGSVAVWRNIKEGRLTKDNLTCSLSTYLIRCCCNHASHLVRDRENDADFGAQQYRITDDSEIAVAVYITENPDDEREEMMRVMQDVVQSFESPCREILWGQYYDRLSQKEIAALTGLKNENTVKATKLRCMKQLKERMYSIFNAH